jgi:hypothetical protein
MKMMLNRVTFAFVCLMCAPLVFAAQLPSIPKFRDRANVRELISEGLGVGRIYVGHSTADDVAAVYGTGFETVEHGANDTVEHGSDSYEMRYAQLGLSFYYCHGDQQKRIFGIKAREPFNGFTARGIVRGKSTLRDVVEAYGEPSGKMGVGVGNADSTFRYEYPGIRFYVAYNQPAKTPNDASLGSKVIVIEVVTSQSGSDCLPSNLK